MGTFSISGYDVRVYKTYPNLGVGEKKRPGRRRGARVTTRRYGDRNARHGAARDANVWRTVVSTRSHVQRVD